MPGCRELPSPGVKATAGEAEKRCPILTGDAFTLYRSGVAGYNYLSVDRPDIPFESKELCRAIVQSDGARHDGTHALVLLLERAVEGEWSGFQVG